jgi:hypothetical protein
MFRYVASANLKRTARLRCQLRFASGPSPHTLLDAIGSPGRAADGAQRNDGGGFTLQSSGAATTESATGNRQADIRTPTAAFSAIVEQFTNAVPGPAPDEVGQLLSEVKQERELRRIIDELVMPHPLFRDLLNGHGFRVHVFGKLLSASTRLGDVDIIFEHLAQVRTVGFLLTRNYCAVILDNVKRHINKRFQREGRNPDIAASVIRKCRHLRLMAEEDHVPYDFVMHTRELHIAASIAAVYDRQNLYRSNFPLEDVPRREGIVVDWVVSHIERVYDFDTVVRLTEEFVRETVERVKGTHVRPTFSFMTRLADFYFAVDNVDRMLAVIEDSHALGIDVAESTYAKFMQLACAFNVAEVPELQLKFRVAPPQCTVATPDMSRLLGYYGRAGGGKPCPECGEPFNHRNPHVDIWERTPDAMKRCKLLHQARVQRGVLEDSPDVPQCSDHSDVAFGMWELSKQRSVHWTATEWRFFILCVIFSPRAMEGIDLLVQNLDRANWDEFLSLQYIRALRFNEPERIVPVLRQWRANGVHLSPLALQQAVMGQLLVREDAIRVDGLSFLAQVHVDNDIYTMRYTLRLIQAHSDSLPPTEAYRRERELLKSLSALSPRSLNVAEAKDSVSDVLPVSSKRHNLYPPE